jgi:hypothetical protein
MIFVICYFHWFCNSGECKQDGTRKFGLENFGTSTCTCKDNSKKDLGEIDCRCVDWIEVWNTGERQQSKTTLGGTVAQAPPRPPEIEVCYDLIQWRYLWTWLRNYWFKRNRNFIISDVHLFISRAVLLLFCSLIQCLLPENITWEAHEELWLVLTL